MAFKGRISPKIVGNWRGRGRGSDASRRRFPLSGHCGFKSPVNRLEFRFKKTHDGATIATWSGHDRAAIGRRSWSWFSNKRHLMIVEMIPWWKIHDRGSIALRSQFDRTTIVEFFRESSWPSDGDRDLMEIGRSRWVHAFAKMRRIVAVWSRSRDMPVDENRSSSWRHVALNEPSNRSHLN